MATGAKQTNSIEADPSALITNAAANHIGACADVAGRAWRPPVLGAAITSDAERVLDSQPEAQDLVELALANLPKFLPAQFEATVDSFVDPYKGSTALVVSLKSSAPYGEVSRAIDQFCNEFWWKYMEVSPVSLIFQGES